MSDEVLLYRSISKERSRILSFRDIEILPFDGQGSPAIKKTVTQAAPVEQPVQASAPVVEAKPKVESPPPKKFTFDANSSLNTANLGIKDILEGQKKKDKQEIIRKQRTTKFTEEELRVAWHSYALKVKREGRNRIHATLNTSEWTLTSELKIILKIGQAQQHDIENEKVPLLEYLRNEVENDILGFEYQVMKVEKISISSSKETFDQLSEENGALEKLRKLFNLDIEY